VRVQDPCPPRPPPPANLRRGPRGSARRDRRVRHHAVAVSVEQARLPTVVEDAGRRPPARGPQRMPVRRWSSTAKSSRLGRSVLRCGSVMSPASHFPGLLGCRVKAAARQRGLSCMAVQATASGKLISSTRLVGWTCWGSRSVRFAQCGGVSRDRSRARIAMLACWNASWTACPCWLASRRSRRAAVRTSGSAVMSVWPVSGGQTGGRGVVADPAAVGEADLQLGLHIEHDLVAAVAGGAAAGAGRERPLPVFAPVDAPGWPWVGVLAVDPR
jgi:hypothetical protein